MRIENIKCRSASTTPEPTLFFELTFSINNGNEVLSDFESILCIGEIPITPLHKIDGKQQSQNLCAEEKNVQKMEFTETYIAFLTKSHTEFIENSRQKNNNGDMIFIIKYSTKTLKPNVLISRIHKSNNILNNNQVDGEILYYKYDSHFHTHTGDMWLMSAKHSPKFLEAETIFDTKEIQISQSDWIQNFSPNLGLGSFFITIFPREEYNIKNFTEYIDRARRALQFADYKSVYAHIRELGTALNNNAGNIFQDNTQEKEKWKRAYKDFNHMASLGLHTEDLKEETNLYYHDAEYLLIAALNLIRFFQKTSKFLHNNGDFV